VGWEAPSRSYKQVGLVLLFFRQPHHIAKPKMLYEISSFPQDFQQILSELLYYERCQIDEVVVAEYVELDDYRDEILSEHDMWDGRDWEIVTSMVTKMVNEGKASLPPIIVKRGCLKDGFHRVTASILLGYTNFPAIDLVTPYPVATTR
jgi:hypothetical protein